MVEKRFKSVDEIEKALRKLRRRVEEVRALESEGIRHEDPKREALETKIRCTRGAGVQQLQWIESLMASVPESWW